MTVVDAIVQGLPPAARLDVRIAKTELVATSHFTAAQRRRLDAVIEQLWWVAALRPDTTGLLPFVDAERPLQELHVLRLVFRGPRRGALALLPALHRSIEHATLFLVDGAGGAHLSLARKRKAGGNNEGVVVDDIVGVDVGADIGDAVAAAFVVGAADLRGVFSAWRRALVGVSRAVVTGAFVVPVDDAAARTLESDLTRRALLLQQQKKQTKQLQRETQMARRVALSLALQDLDREVSGIQLRIQGTGS